MRRTADRTRNGKSEIGRAYQPPKVVRVRVETARLKVGYEDANQFCTVHVHNDVATDCPF